MQQFITGAIAMAYSIGGLFFFRFWRETRDRLFAIFAFAFWLLALTRVARVLPGQPDEPRTYLYWVRFLAYLLILAAIFDKNRPAEPRD